MNAGCSLDRDLLIKVSTGDEESLEELLRRYERKLYIFGFYLTGCENSAGAILSEVFLRAVRDPRLFVTCPLFSAEIFKTAVYVAIETLSAVEGQALGSCAADSERDTVASALRRLPLEYKLAILLKDILELETQECVRALCLSHDEFGRRLCRGRLMFRRLLQRDRADSGAGIRVNAEQRTRRSEVLV